MSTTKSAGVRQVAEVSSDYTADPADYLILVDTSGGPVTVTLPSGGRSMPFGKRVVDAGGQSETNNITVGTEGTEAIRRGGSEVDPVTLAQNDASWDFHPQATDGDWAYTPSVQDHSQLQGVSEGDHRSQEQVQDIVGALISAAGSDISVTYDDAGDSLTIGLSDSVDVDDISVGSLAVTSLLNTGEGVETISSGSIDASAAFIRVEGEGGAADDLDNMTGASHGDVVILKGDGEAITVRDGQGGTGQFVLASNNNFELGGAQDRLVVQFDTSFGVDSWVEISRSDGG